MTHSNKGFTLIETLIYIGLFAIIIGGGMVATYAIIESTERTASRVALSEEANFLLLKLDWMLNSIDVEAGGITSPALDTPGDELVLHKHDLEAELTISLNGTDIELTKNFVNPSTEDTTAVLNSSIVTVTDLEFSRTKPYPGQPDKITATFTLTSSLSGEPLTETFETTKYLRQ